MRIIGGILKGKTVTPPAGYKARPTTDFAREGLFNVLSNEYEMEGLAVLDLFGGTGAVSKWKGLLSWTFSGAPGLCPSNSLPEEQGKSIAWRWLRRMRPS